MTHEKKYLDYQFEDSEDTASAIDEMSLWSSVFGQLLLSNVCLKRGATLLDLGSGTGFPLLELAQRLGPTSRCIGIDPWENANRRALFKAKMYGLSNVQVIGACADQLPFDPDSVDMIVSNLGINNFSNPIAAFNECFRVLKPNCRLSLTTNLNGHWQLFYDIFEVVLTELGFHSILPSIREQQAHRGSIESVQKLFTDSGFVVRRIVTDTLVMPFLDGTALLNHAFVKLGWISSWRDLIPVEHREVVFQLLEARLNASASQSEEGCLRLTVPMLFVEGEKVISAPVDSEES